MQIDISRVSFRQSEFPPNANWHLKSIISPKLIRHQMQIATKCKLTSQEYHSPNLIPTKCKLTSQVYHFTKTNFHQMEIDISRVSFRQN